MFRRYSGVLRTVCTWEAVAHIVPDSCGGISRRVTGQLGNPWARKLLPVGLMYVSATVS